MLLKILLLLILALIIQAFLANTLYKDLFVIRLIFPLSLVLMKFTIHNRHNYTIVVYYYTFSVVLY